jgi:two-component system NtrC family sensor kinase
MMPKLGIRLQILLALFVLLALAFVPLFVAVVSLTRATMQNVREASARSVGRAVVAQVEEARLRRTSAELAALLDSEIGAGGVTALAVYDEQGKASLRVGDPDVAAALPDRVTASEEQTLSLSTSHGPAIQVIVPGPRGSVAAVLRTDEDTGKGAPLLRWLALYTGLFAFALLTFAYIALTRLIVRPLDAISAAARRVADGARGLEVPEAGPAEMLGLSRSLSEMTSKLRADEQRMRDQIFELERGAQRLREAQDRLIRSERLASVGRLSAGLAHEIGNPIAALLGLEDLLLQGGLTESEQHDFLSRIRKETERIHHVLRDLLDFARADSTPSGVPRGLLSKEAGTDKPGAVSEAIDDVVALVKPQRTFRDVELRVEAETALPRVALGHERIMQVLLNLLMNAADATGPSGKVLLKAERNGTGVRLIVEDNGPGIHPSVRERLFEPFVTTKEVGKGTGLGLAACRGLVESAQGTIRIDESYQKGARFVVELPIAQDA